MNKEIKAYNKQIPEDKKICNILAEEINRNLPEAENKIWHAHPVWFLDGNPVVGYSKLKILFVCFSGVGNHSTKLLYTKKEASKLLRCVTHPLIR